MRNCDPGADNRLPIDRASRCWNDDHKSDCCEQSKGLRAPSWLLASMQDSARRTPTVDGTVDGIEPQQIGDESRIAGAICGNEQLSCSSARHRLLKRSSSPTQANFGLTDNQLAVHPFEWVCASGRIASSFVLLRPFLSRTVSSETVHFDGVRRDGVCHTTGLISATSRSQNGQRTHSLTRVSDEKRNADECPPTGGKSNCHR